MAHIWHDLAVAGEVAGGVLLGAGLLLAAPEVAAGAALYEGAELLAGMGLGGLAEGAFMAGDVAYAVDTAAVVAEGMYGTEAVAEFGLGMMGAGGAGIVGGGVAGIVDAAGVGHAPGTQGPGTPGQNPQQLPPPGSAAAAGSDPMDMDHSGSSWHPSKGGGHGEAKGASFFCAPTDPLSASLAAVAAVASAASALLAATHPACSCSFDAQPSHASAKDEK